MFTICIFIYACFVSRQVNNDDEHNITWFSDDVDTKTKLAARSNNADAKNDIIKLHQRKNIYY